jgi:hypothetical protein
MNFFARLFNRLTGHCWKPVTDGKGWGIYHPTARHRWDYPMTKDEAETECNRRNSSNYS